ncbi:hypothetical protein TUM3792_06580 [Shewanella sp. MBTL60-007]|nr:hypothetical protein TUM3792_06580 [Shewanella sp. MBTL60-007]
MPQVFLVKLKIDTRCSRLDIIAHNLTVSKPFDWCDIDRLRLAGILGKIKIYQKNELTPVNPMFLMSICQ